MPDGIKILVKNKKARHDFFIEDTLETGIALAGTEVKSVRLGKANIRDAYAAVKNGEVYMYNMHISPYEKGNVYNRDPLRERKLLLHRSEIKRLIGATKEKGYALIPTAVYLKRGIVKVELALAKGKKLYDKRADIARRDANRDMHRRLREHNR